MRKLVHSGQIQTAASHGRWGRYASVGYNKQRFLLWEGTGASTGVAYSEKRSQRM